MPGILVPANAEASRIGSYAHNSARDAAITNPYNGLQIYNVAAGTVQFWDGTAWQNVTPTIPDPIPSYADPTARDAAQTSPVEGTTIYVESLKTLQVYNGTQWSEVSGGGNPLFLAGT